jgi:Prokaryotic phospholipase A2
MFWMRHIAVAITLYLPLTACIEVSTQDPIDEPELAEALTFDEDALTPNEDALTPNEDVTANKIALTADEDGLNNMAALVAPHAAARVSPAVQAAARTVTTELVYGSYYRIYKERYPNELDWSNDGCSVPFSVPIANHYKDLFEKSCDRHDFGYRNHDKSGYDRQTVDSRFLTNMSHQCEVVYDDPWDIPARVLCNDAAQVFYLAVRRFAGGHW